MKPMRLSTEDAILDAAFELFSRRPGASLNEVAVRAGVGRATLHRHFKNRDALIEALTRVAMAELNEAVEAAVADATSHTDGLRRTLGAIVPLADRHWFLEQEPAPSDPDIVQAERNDRALLEAEIEGARAEGAFPPDAPTRWIAEAYDALIYAAWSMVRSGEATPQQAADLAWRTLTTGLGSSLGSSHDLGGPKP